MNQLEINLKNHHINSLMLIVHNSGVLDLR